MNINEFENVAPQFTSVIIKNQDSDIIGLISLTGVRPITTAVVYVSINDECFSGIIPTEGSGNVMLQSSTLSCD